MKTTRLLLIALCFIATLFVSTACEDDYTIPEQEDLVGRWEMTYADKRIQVEGALFYTLNADGTCLIQHDEFLSKPEEHNPFTDGKWWLAQSDGKTVMTIHCEATDYSKEQTIRLTITRFHGNKFHAFSEGSTQEKIFLRTKTFSED